MAFQVDIADPQLAQLAHPQARLQKHLQDGVVARRGAGQRQELVVLIGPQVAAPPALLPGRLDAFRRRAGEVAVGNQKAEELPHRGQLAGPGYPAQAFLAHEA